MKLNILFGGKAGQGPNILTQLLGNALIKQDYHVFYSRDYQSLIRGGHNFNVLTFSDFPVSSNESKIDILICLDEKTEDIHKKDLKKQAIILKGQSENIYFAGRLFKLLNLNFELLEDELKELKNFSENIKNAKQGYSDEKKEIEIIKPNKKRIYFINGTQGIARGAIKSGLDIYYAYPMTPATPLLSELAAKQIEDNFLVLELENEISVINAALGSAVTGAKSMIGTSGGGFDLMGEALSMAGQAGLPLVVYLSQRPGPGTGVATYTSQGDLNMSRYSGHGRFSRVVVAPGDPLESEELTSQAFYFAHNYKIPCIVLSDKHLGESFYTLDKEPRITKSEKLIEFKKYNSYECDKNGIATDNVEIIKENVKARLKKQKDIEKNIEKFDTFKIYGKKNSKNLIVSWGSTKGAILDSIHGLDVKFLQVLYIEPFSKKIKSELEKAKNIMIVENSEKSQLSQLIAEKTGIILENQILRYDGRPFLADELKEEIKKKLEGK